VQYELVRAQVIGSVGNLSAGQSRGVGLALVLSEGMPGWLKTVETALRASIVSRGADSPEPSLHELPPQNGAVSVWLSSVQRHQVTALLASLVLSIRPLAREALREGYR
jgi:hypothetical protein